MSLTVGTNSYISRANADLYFADTLRNTAWTALSTGQKDQALISAASMLDRQYWAGAKVSPSQAMEWPRTGVVDKYGNDVSSASVPQDIVDANCELALILYTTPSAETNASNSSNTKRVKAGPAEVEFFRPVRAGRFPTIIQELIGQYLGSGSNASGITSPYVSGNCGSSKFDCNPYDLTSGLA